MTITERIQESILHIRRMNRTPDRIYIGRQTEIDLRQELRPHEQDYKTIFGLPFFQVNVAEHLDVTAKADE